jgi:PleD family two-component response regulator
MASKAAVSTVWCWSPRLAVLSIALLTSILDARLEARTADLAHSLTVANRELTQLALHDTLTGLPNRMLLDDRINQAMKKVHEQGGCFALMFIDLDGFKPVNDAFGHHMGDQLLREVGLRCVKICAARTPWRGSAATSSCCWCDWPSPTMR